MNKSIVALTLSSVCVLACAQTPPAQTATTEQPAAAPPATAAPAPAAPAPAAAPAQRQSQPEPALPPAPAFREVTIPAGTSLSVTLLTEVASNTSKVEDPVKGSIAKAVTISGVTALPVGTQMLGSVTEAAESGRVKGKATVAFRFDRLVINGETVRVQTAKVQGTASDTKSDVKKGGLGAGAGAIVGGVIGGGKGAAIGAVAGGAGTVLTTKGSEVEIPSGTVVNVLVQDPITVRVAVK